MATSKHKHKTWTPDKLRSRLIETISEQWGIDEEEVTLDSDLFNDLGGDSLDAVELAMALEEEFELEINEDRMDKACTVAEVEKLLIAALGKRLQS